MEMEEGDMSRRTISRRTLMRAAGTGALAGCGTPGKAVTITVGGYTLPGVPPWDNSRPRGL